LSEGGALLPERIKGSTIKGKRKRARRSVRGGTPEEKRT